MTKRASREYRLFTVERLRRGQAVACDAGQRNYLVNVLRLGEGATVRLFNGRDGEWRAALRMVSKKVVALEPSEQLRAQTGGPDVTLFFAPLKKERLDYLVQKATELGARIIQPVITEFTQSPRLKLERLQANVIEAAEQCGVLRLPEMRAPVALDAALADWPTSQPLVFCDEAAQVAHPIAALAGLKLPAAVLIGPEGGFSPAERARVSDLPNSRVISLGPRVLRADTAAVAALTLVSAVAEDWRETPVAVPAAF
ncbi:MAG: 16S rRNA (uracil(1498)-N(3))-methyltransferase [Pseudomonadota bacterium]